MTSDPMFSGLEVAFSLALKASTNYHKLHMEGRTAQKIRELGILQRELDVIDELIQLRISGAAPAEGPAKIAEYARNGGHPRGSLPFGGETDQYKGEVR